MANSKNETEDNPYDYEDEVPDMDPEIIMDIMFDPDQLIDEDGYEVVD